MSTTGQRLSNYFGDRKLPTGDLSSFVARYWYVILIAAIVALAAGLRLWDLGERAIHHDESIHIKFAWDISRGFIGQCGSVYCHDPVYHGPFQYFGTAGTFLLFGDNNYTSRLLPALFGIALVGLPFLLRRQLGTVGVVLAAGMLTMSPALLYFSRFARNDIYVAFFTFAIVVCMWRYLEDRKDRWLIAIAPLLALSFAAKEVTLIITASFLVFLNVLLATQLVQQMRASRDLTPGQTAVAYLVTLPTAWLIAAFWSATGLITRLRSGRISSLDLTAAYAFVAALTLTMAITARLMDSRTFVIFLAFAVVVIALFIALAFLLRRAKEQFSLSELPPVGAILIVVGTLVAVQFAAGIQKLPGAVEGIPLLGGDLHSLFRLSGMVDAGYLEEPVLMRVSVLVLLVGTAFVGFTWNWRVWAASAALFYAVFFVFFTSFFTNGGDIWNVYTFFTTQGGGFLHVSGEFWNGQGGFWTGIWGSMDYWLGQQDVRRGSQPDYYYFMFLPVYEFLPLIFGLGGAMFYAFRGKLEQTFMVGAALILITTLSLISDNVLGIIGEKMPWLTVHLALPLALLAAKVLNDMLSSLRVGKSERDDKGETRMTLDMRIAGPLAGVASLATVATLVFLAVGPASASSAVAWLFSLGALAGVTWVAANVSWRTAGQIAAVGLFSALMVFTVQASARAAFEEGVPNGVPPEMFIYAQGSAGLGLAIDNVFSAAEESGLGKDIKIIIDDTSNIWPWPWYVRDYENVEYSKFTDGFAPESGAIVLVGTSNQSKMEPFLDRYHEGQPYTHMWWFPELYKNLEIGEFLGDVVNGDLFDIWRRFFFDREVKNATSTPNMIVYIPKEFSAPVQAPKAAGIRTKAPELPAESVTVLATLGSEVGQFSQPADIAVDALGNVYVVDTLNQRVQIIAPDGTVTSIGEPGTNAGEFANPRSPDYEVDDGPWGMTLGPEGGIYVADTWGHRIQRFGPDMQLDPTFNIGGLFGPRDIAVMADGNLIVVDTGNKRLGIYDQSGSLQRIIGEEGDGHGQFNEPTSISISSNGAIYVADYWNKRIQRFDSQMRYSGEFEVDSWGSRGTTDRAYIVALADGRVIATDPANGNILVFDANGEEIAARSLPSRSGTSRPIGIAVDPAEEFVYITDSLTSQVVRVPLAVLLAPPPVDSTP